MVPQALERLINEHFKTPYAIFEFFRAALAEECLTFSYILTKKQFLELATKHLRDADQADLTQIFKLFAIRPAQAMTAKIKKVLNVLEFMSALILLADFGESSGDDLQHNAELIEHKVNLLLLLFDLRKETSMNISEVIILLKTAMQSQSKVFPTVLFFRNPAVLNEIKDAMMGLFRGRLDSGVNALLGARKTTKEDDIAKLREKELTDKQFLGFVKKQQQQTGEKLSSGFHDMSTLSTNVTGADEEQKL